MLHVYDKSFSRWIVKHNNLALIEAKQMRIKKDKQYMAGSGFKAWLRIKIWQNLPRFFQPFILFFFRYFILGGILNGKLGFYYCFLHDFLYPLLINFYSYEFEIKYSKKGEI